MPGFQKVALIPLLVSPVLNIMPAERMAAINFIRERGLVPSRPGPFPLVLPAIAFPGLWPLQVSLLPPCELDGFRPVSKESVL